MTNEQRLDFINATLCLMNAPSKAPKDQFPGARTRYDDFMAYHLTNAGSLHDTIGLFPPTSSSSLRSRMLSGTSVGTKDTTRT